MRKKEMTIVITFPTTTGAMRMETAAAQYGFPGRLIPVPGEISAGCGMAWKCGIHTEEEAVRFLDEQQISFEGIYKILL